MPTYGYRCQKCADEFDVFQKMNDDPVTECPKCGGAVKRMFHPVGIIFKGSGFYTTDYKNKSTKPAPVEAKPESKSDTKSENKTESKETTGTKPEKPLEKATS